MTCLVCSTNSIKEKFSVSEKNNIYLCGNCEVEFLFPQLDDAALGKLYTESYYAAWGLHGLNENEDLKAMKMATFNLRLKLIEKFQASGPLLDIGCATGYLLEAAKQKKFEPYGIEYSEYSASIAQKKFGLERVFRGTLEESLFPPSFFNVITMFDLIEHVRNPQVTLNNAAELLQKNGIIVISTPDTGTLSNKWMGKRWTHYKLEHFFYFNKKSMLVLAKKCHLKMIYYERSKKALNLEYLNTQLKTYNHWLLSPLIASINFCLPDKLKKWNFYIPIGEMTIVLQKNNENGQ